MHVPQQRNKPPPHLAPTNPSEKSEHLSDVLPQHALGKHQEDGSSETVDLGGDFVLELQQLLENNLDDA